MRSATTSARLHRDRYTVRVGQRAEYLGAAGRGCHAANPVPKCCAPSGAPVPFPELERRPRQPASRTGASRLDRCRRQLGGQARGMRLGADLGEQAVGLL